MKAIPDKAFEYFYSLRDSFSTHMRFIFKSPTKHLVPQYSVLVGQPGKAHRSGGICSNGSGRPDSELAESNSWPRNIGA